MRLHQDKLQPHVAYTVDVQAKMCPENVYRGPWSEWGASVEWRTTGTSGEVEGKMTYQPGAETHSTVSRPFGSVNFVYYVFFVFRPYSFHMFCLRHRDLQILVFCPSSHLPGPLPPVAALSKKDVSTVNTGVTFVFLGHVLDF